MIRLQLFNDDPNTVDDAEGTTPSSNFDIDSLFSLPASEPAGVVESNPAIEPPVEPDPVAPPQAQSEAVTEQTATGEQTETATTPATPAFIPDPTLAIEFDLRDTAIPTEMDLEFHQEWKSILADKERNASHLSLDAQKLSDSLKALRKQVKEALEELDSFQTTGWTTWRERKITGINRLRAEAREEEKQRREILANAEGLSPLQKERDSQAQFQSQSAGQHTNASEGWRNVSIKELDFTSIKGFGAKKKEALVETCPTLGKLEDLRGTFEGLTSIKGIGREMSGEIENVVLNWLTKNRDSGLLQFRPAGVVVAGTAEMEIVTDNVAEEPAPEAIISPAQSQAQEPAPTPTPATKTPAKPKKKPAADQVAIEPTPPTAGHAYPSFDEWELLTDDARQNYITNRSNELCDETELELTAAANHPNRKASGRDAFDRGLDIIDCPCIPGTEQDDWLRGYLYQESLNGNGDGDEGNSDEGSDEDSDADGNEYDNSGLDKDKFPDSAEGLKSIFTEVKTYGVYNPARTSDMDYQPCFKSGHAQFISGLPWTKCDEAPGPARINWLRGWLAGQKEESESQRQEA